MHSLFMGGGRKHSWNSSPLWAEVSSSSGRVNQEAWLCFGSGTVLAEWRIVPKLLSILDNPSHQLHIVLAGERTRFSQTLINVKFSTECQSRSILPVAVHTLQFISLSFYRLKWGRHRQPNHGLCHVIWC